VSLQKVSLPNVSKRKICFPLAMTAGLIETSGAGAGSSGPVECSSTAQPPTRTRPVAARKRTGEERSLAMLTPRETCARLDERRASSSPAGGQHLARGRRVSRGSGPVTTRRWAEKTIRQRGTPGVARR
jgi:hypothetical protein